MKAKVIAFLLSFYLPCFGQVAIDNDCGFRSCRIFGRVVLTVLGLNTVREMLEHNQRLTLWLNIGSSVKCVDAYHAMHIVLMWSIPHF